MVFASPTFPRAALLGSAVILVALTGCSSQVSVEKADVAQWQATALPSPTAGAPGAVAVEESGKLVDTDSAQVSVEVPAGRYTLTMVCEGGGKAFLYAESGGKDVADVGAACYAGKESTPLSLSSDTEVTFRLSSVDAPLLWSYRLTAN
ncbi:hypothetical protein [Pseudarthrobacter sp. PS3-L1]|uniref:hypothetical protein n=1 Tax=Pseudarthrobacter sp. PS3-L1 TaxID=3046207 RepID=UPI0024BB3D60|nr:hypothetical protein [Pseudarthrobacter sp. PS3-L1]MDJ0319224.1 hypothetical protein [Pseudarthrobacter sp. PS3-L1]